MAQNPKKSNLHKSGSILGSILVVAVSAGLISLIFFLITPSKAANANAEALDLTALETLESLQNKDVGGVVTEIRSMQESEAMESSIAASIAASEEASEAESIALEESSMARAEYESSVAEESHAKEMEALLAPLSGSHIVPGTVSYNLDDTDIPYIRQLFSYCVVIGNSRAKNAVDCGILTENEVKYQSGTPVNVITPYALAQAYLYKPKTLFILGLNDVASYDCDFEQYKADYTSMIRQYLSINPGSEIYVMESLPLPEEAWSYFYRAMTWLPSFNDAAKRMCEENGWNYVSASEYADFSLINSEDHAHYGKPFYFLWAQTMAEQLHLYEDLAGLPYDVDWSLY